MTKTIEQQTEQAMRRITQHINRSAGQHQRAVNRVRAGQPSSEGTASAQTILRSVPLASLHRVDTRQLPDDSAAMFAGRPEQRCGQGVCRGLPTCTDTHCEGHPANAVTEDERDARLTRWVWGAYAATVAALIVWGVLA